MELSVCTYGFIPLRSQPAEGASLETQILFGESFEVLEHISGWCRVKCRFDGYEGWIDKKLVVKMEPGEVNRLEEAKEYLVPAPFGKVVKESDSTAMILTAGSRLVFNGTNNNELIIGNQVYYWQGRRPSSTFTIEETARAFLNTPYLWGGRTFYGIDCSGFIQIVYKLAGIYLPRNASQQYEAGLWVNYAEEAVVGDLAFFCNEEDKIDHVGICLGRGRLIHASGSVRIDTLDHKGIFNHERHGYTHRLKTIKRLIHEP